MANSNTTAVAERDETVENLRKPPRVFPGFCKINSDGFCWREWMVRLPETAIVDDLKVPDIWKQVQLSPQTALRKHDHLYIVSYDESFAAEAIVSQATANAATLSGLRLITLVERTTPLLNDGTYKIEWIGNGYIVKRIKDGQLMTYAVQTLGEAERDLSRLYPKKI